jgi:hypothetical protein
MAPRFEVAGFCIAPPSINLNAALNRLPAAIEQTNCQKKS